MLTLQSNKEIRINKGDTGMAPLFVNIGDSLRPIGYEFKKDIKIDISSTKRIVWFTHPMEREGVIAFTGATSVDSSTLYLLNTDNELPIIRCEFYEDAWREYVLEAGEYTFTYQNSSWYLNNEEVDISKYGFVFKEKVIVPEPTTIKVTYELLDNDSEVAFQLWPILEIPQTPALKKIISPKENKISTYLYDELISEVHTNTVNSYGEILLKFFAEDTEQLERGKYLYNLKANLYNSYSNVYEKKTIINRTPFYIIDDNFTDRIW